MLKVKEWLLGKEKQCEFTIYENSWAAKRLSDGTIFYEGQIIKMMLLNIHVVSLHNDEIHVDVRMESDGEEDVLATCEINQLYAPRKIC